MSEGDSNPPNRRIALVDAAVQQRAGRAPPPAAFEEALGAVLTRFAEGAALPREHSELAHLARELVQNAPIWILEQRLRELSHDGYLRGALVAIAADLRLRPRPEVALLLAQELLDALDPELGIEVARSLLTIPEVDESRLIHGGPYASINMILGDALLDAGDPFSAVRHFEAVLVSDIDNARAVRGWRSAMRALERRGVVVTQRARGLALLDGLEDLELSAGLDSDRYELGRPLGRGRHAVVYQAYDRRVGRDVAIKRLLAGGTANRGGPTSRLIEARFFSEARTLARVRSPHVVALLDAQPRHRFIALSLCRGGNLRLAIRRRLLGPADLPRVGEQLQAALRAVHTAGAVHRDIKPVNILVREARRGSSIALADFGLALQDGPRDGPRAGTLRYLAPELRDVSRPGSARATPQSDIFSAGVVLLELGLAPRPLPADFDRLDSRFDPRPFIPDGLPDGWSARIEKMLSPDPRTRRLAR